jgi:hypothetical protein
VGRVEREWADIWRPPPKVVFSTRLDTVEGNARLAGSDVAGELAQFDGDVGIGGPGLAALAADLIDEYQLFVNPVVGGGGKPLFVMTLDELEWHQHGTPRGRATDTTRHGGAAATSQAGRTLSYIAHATAGATRRCAGSQGRRLDRLVEPLTATGCRAHKTRITTMASATTASASAHWTARDAYQARATWGLCGDMRSPSPCLESEGAAAGHRVARVEREVDDDLLGLRFDRRARPAAPRRRNTTIWMSSPISRVSIGIRALVASLRSRATGGGPVDERTRAAVV